MLNNLEAHVSLNRKWDDGLLRRLLELQGQGKSAREIGQELGMSRNAVLGKLSRLRGDSKPRSTVWTEEMTTRLLELRQNGLSCSKIAAELGVTLNSVTSKVERMGAPPAVKGTAWTEATIKELLELHSKGTPQPQIARRLRVTGSAIRHKLNRLGIYRAVTPKPAPRVAPPRIVLSPKHAAPRPIIAEAIPKDAVEFADLKTCGCRWIFNDLQDDEAKYCGRPSLPGRSWCVEHAARARRE